MISLPHPVRVFLHSPATALRKCFDAPSGLVTTAFSQDPMAGHLFLFLNPRRDRLKIRLEDRDPPRADATSRAASRGAKTLIDVRPGEPSRLGARPQNRGRVAGARRALPAGH
jgi:transposase